MFTSRAEYRLSLRQDNADMRLTQKGFDAGVVGSERAEALRLRLSALNAATKTLNEFSLPRTEWSARSESLQMRQKDGKHKSAAEVLSMPDVTLSEVVRVINDVGAETQNPIFGNYSVGPLIFDTLEATCKYANYLSRQEEEMERWKKSGAMRIPADIEYSRDIFPFAAEELEKLRLHRPETLHAASQIQGITPHALIFLQTYLSRGRHHKRNKSADGAFEEGDAAFNDLVATGKNFTQQSKHYQNIEDV